MSFRKFFKSSEYERAGQLRGMRRKKKFTKFIIAIGLVYFFDPVSAVVIPKPTYTSPAK